MSSCINFSKNTLDFVKSVLGTSMSDTEARVIASLYANMNNISDETDIDQKHFESFLQEYRSGISDNTIDTSKDALINEKVKESLNNIAKTAQKTSATIAQKRTLLKLSLSLSGTLTNIKNNPNVSSTVSVSNYKGKTAINVDLKKYERFRVLGNMIHKFLEYYYVKQVESNTDKSIVEVLTEAKTLYDDFIADGQYTDTLKGLDMNEKEVWNFISNFLTYNQHLLIEKYVFIPEFTLIVPSSENPNKFFIGRVDLLAIAPDGTVSVIEFKTKKVKRNAIDDKNTRFDDVSEIIEVLDTELYDVVPTLDSNPNLIFKRTVMHEWYFQNYMYTTMLRKQGIKVADDKNKVLIFVYQTNKDLKVVRKGFAVVNFNDYFHNRAFKQHPEDPNRSVLTLSGRNLMIIKQTVDETFTNEEEIIEEKEKKLENLHIYKPSLEQLNELKASVYDKINSKIAQLNTILNDETLDEGLKVLYEQELEFLQEYKKLLDRVRDETMKKELHRAQTFSFLLKSTELESKRIVESYTEINKEFEILFEKYKLNPSKENYEKLKQKLAEINRLKERNDLLTHIYNGLREVRDELLLSDKTEQSTPNSVIDDINQEIYDNIELNNSIYLNTIQQFVIAALSEINPESFQRLKKDAVALLLARKSKILKKIKKLNTNKAGLLRIGFRKYFATKDIFYRLKYRDRDVRLKIEKDELEKALENLHKELEEVDELLNAEFDRDFIAKLVNNALIATSNLYLGKKFSFTGKEVSTASRFLLNLQATITHPDLGVASFVGLLKNALALAEVQYTSDERLQNVINVATEIIKTNPKYNSTEKLNDAITEIREVMYYEDGVKKTKTEVRLVSPLSKSYEDTYKAKKQAYFNAQKAFKNAFIEYQDALAGTDTEKITQAQERLQEAQEIRRALYRDFYKWMLDNCNLPYVDEYYLSKLVVPDEIQEELDDIATQLNVIYEQDFTEWTEEDLDAVYILKKRRNELMQLLEEEYSEAYEIVQQSKKFWTPVYQQELYEKRKREIEEMYVDYPEEIAKWRQKYEIEVFTEEWYAEREAILEQMHALYDGLRYSSNGLAIYEDYIAAREELQRFKSLFRVDGKYAFHLMTSEELDHLNMLEEKVESLLALLSENTRIDKETKEKLNALKKQLYQIQTLELNASYVKDIEQKTKKLNELRLIALQASQEYANNPENLDLAQAYYVAYKNFLNYEAEYKEWFEKTHDSKYTGSIFHRFDIATAKPKKFNYRYVPAAAVREKYSKTIGKPEFFTKYTLNESAKNPDYVEHFEETPLPKGLVIDQQGNYHIVPGYENSVNINDRFKEIHADADARKVYTATLNYYVALQKQMYGRKLSYAIPGYSMTFMENFKRRGFLGGLMANLYNFYDANIRAYGQQEKSEDIYGMNETDIRQKFTRQLDPNLQTKNAIESILMFAVEAMYNEQMYLISPEVESIIRYYEHVLSRLNKYLEINKEDKAVLEKRNNLQHALELMRTERDKIMKGAKFEKTKAKFLRKIMNIFLKAVSMKRLGFDVAMQVKNFTAASAHLIVNANDAHYSDKNLLFGYYKLTSIRGFLTSMTKMTELPKDVQLYRFFNPLQKDLTKYAIYVLAGTGRKLLTDIMDIGNLAFLIQEKGDAAIGAIMMFTILDSYKYSLKSDPTKRVSAYEALYVDDKGILRIDADVNMTMEDLLFLREIMISVLRRTQGNYADADLAPIQRNVFVSLMFFFRKYLVPMLINIFDITGRPSWRTDEVTTGYLSTFFSAFSHFSTKDVLLQAVTGIIPFYQKEFLNEIKVDTEKVKIGNYYSRKVSVAGRYLVIGTLLHIASSLVLLRLKRARTSGNDEDDDNDSIYPGLSWTEKFAYRVLLGTSSEVTSFLPIGTYTDDYIRNFTSVSSIGQDVIAIGDAGWQLSKYIYYLALKSINEEAAQELREDLVYKRDERTYLSKGDLKFKRALYEYSGIANILSNFYPDDKIRIWEKNAMTLHLKLLEGSNNDFQSINFDELMDQNRNKKTRNKTKNNTQSGTFADFTDKK